MKNTKDNCEKKEELNPSSVEYIAGNEALYSIFKKYFFAIIGGIFAILLAKPELASQLSYKWFDFPMIITSFITIGVLGIFFGELRISVLNLTKKQEEDPPMWVKKICSMYCMTGFFLFVWLFYSLIGIK